MKVTWHDTETVTIEMSAVEYDETVKSYIFYMTEYFDETVKSYIFYMTEYFTASPATSTNEYLKYDDTLDRIIKLLQHGMARQDKA